MKEKAKWTRIIYIIGVIALIIGAIDPLEGSVIIIVPPFTVPVAVKTSKILVPTATFPLVAKLF